jgi:hypothetical protein
MCDENSGRTSQRCDIDRNELGLVTHEDKKTIFKNHIKTTELRTFIAHQNIESKH